VGTVAQEIERKFLLRDDSWREFSDAGCRYIQGYLANNDRCSVRIRIAGTQAFLGLKSATLGISRAEFDYAIPLADAEALLTTLCEQPLIDKTRYLVRDGLHVWEIDVFHGDNEGLVVAELELDSEDESFERPAWLGAEVSDDPRYYNVCLVKHPYKHW
jgi:adenylate cyclase